MLEELIGGVLVHVDDFRRFNIVNDKHGELEVAILWSLTQFYYVDFSKSRIGVLSTNTQSRFASVVVDGVLGPQRLARHT